MAGGLPTGTVTFLFSDIEGSTRLAGRPTTDWVDLLEAHRAILRAAFGAHHGHEVKTEGDGFFVAFADAADAVRAAIAAQRGMQSHGWPEGAPLRVRIGLHTGPAEVVDDDYIGLTVHHAARVSGVAHGGQVVLSDATRALLASARLEDSGITITDLGLHSLKDIDDPIRLYQADGDGLPNRFPPLRSGIATPTNLPAALTSFVGRGDEVRDVQKLIAEHRLVTLTGAGGAGKTRLAIEVARSVASDHPGGVWLVELAAVTDEALVPQAVAEAMGLRQSEGRGAIVDNLVAALSARPVLIVLDNCEHVVEACAALTVEVLQRAERCRILATSREALGCAGEHAWKVPSLSVRDDILGEAPAVRLFIDRAEAAGATIAKTPEVAEAIAQLCERLDGIPLAIELAAARARTMSPVQLAGRLDDRFRLLTGGTRGALPRQQTLQALVDWSHNLLVDGERTLLRRLAVFAGGFTLESAEAVCADDALDAVEVIDNLDGLVAKSLVAPTDTPDRYRLLETIRHYARQKLVEADEVERTRDAHLAHFVSVAGSVAAELRQTQSARSMDLIAAEHENMRAALEWACGRPALVEQGARLADALWVFWWIRGHYTEASDWARRLLAAGELSPVLRARTMWIEAGFRSLVDRDRESARTALETIRDLQRQNGDTQALALTLAWLGWRVVVYEDFQEALALYRDARELAKSADDALVHGWALLMEGSIDDLSVPEREQLFRESIEVARRAGNRWNTAMATKNLGFLAAARGELDNAWSLFDEAITAWRSLGDTFGLAQSLGQMSWFALTFGDVERAALAADEAAALLRRAGVPTGELEVRRGVIAVLRGESDGWECVAHGLDMVAATGAPVERLNALNEAAWYLGRSAPRDERMQRVLSQLEAVCVELPDASGAGWHTIAEVLRSQGEPRAEEIFGRLISGTYGGWDGAHAASSLGLAWIEIDRGEDESARQRLADIAEDITATDLAASAMCAAALVAERSGDLMRAAGLLGAARRAFTGVDAMRDVVAAAGLEARLRAALGDSFEEAEAALSSAEREEIAAEIRAACALQAVDESR